MPTEKRRNPRTESGGKVEITYVDAEGLRRYELVEARDVSPGGCKVILKFRCPARTLVNVRIPPKPAANATVRYQRQSPRGYITGLEIADGLAK